ncbi:MAG: xanthine dehydrogenase family protein molybdopterin-binding subunit [Pseudomonadota bacterium]|nr:xanthine dehydrogenase family protein molybdopterin-binding subunit [Pseudomonadota bacterium]
MSFGMGQSVRRTEDAALLVGKGSFADDVNLDGQIHMAVVRSPHAHADLGAIDGAAALAAPGVMAVLTAADLAADGVSDIPCLTRDPSAEFRNRDGSRMPDVPYPLLADGKVRYVGEPVAVVVAETAVQALDGAEATVVDYQPLAAVTEAMVALAHGAPQLRDNAPGNRIFDWEKGDGAAVDAAFAAATHVTSLKLVNNRLVTSYLEPRAAIGAYDPATGRYTLIAGSQGVHRHKANMATCLGIEPDEVLAISGDVGGGFGGKGFTYPEYVLVSWAAQRVGRPVKWVASRGDTFLVDLQSRDHVSHCELALDGDGNFLALRATSTCNLGANIAPRAVYVPLNHMSSVLSGVYAFPCIHLRLHGAFTNTTPVHVYRGVGRAEAMYLVERLVDQAAVEMGLDRVELRRRNLISPDAMPYASPMGITYDSGDFAACLHMAVDRSGWAGFAPRRQAATGRGRLRGIGLASYIEDAGGPPTEFSRVLVNPDGTVDGFIGSQSNGQGHGTVFAQVLGEQLGVAFDQLRITWGNSDVVADGVGSFGSRSTQTVGSALVVASSMVIDKGRAAAAQLLQVGPDDVDYCDGRFTVAGSGRAISLGDVAQAMAGDDMPAEFRGALAAELTYQTDGDSYPNGCHVAEVEIDPETGVVTLAAYTAVDDFGRLVNPMLVDGQVHGAVVQGIGQAMYERTVFDPATGQMLSGSFMDYTMPRADDMPPLATGTVEVPSLNNPLGVKGAGEGGTIGAPPAVMNAIIDALRPLGIDHLDMPATPEVVWRAVTNR